MLIVCTSMANVYISNREKYVYLYVFVCSLSLSHTHTKCIVEVYKTSLDILDIKEVTSSGFCMCMTYVFQVMPMQLCRYVRVEQHISQSVQCRAPSFLSCYILAAW